MGWRQVNGGSKKRGRRGKDGKKIRIIDGEVECAIISRVKRRAVVKLLSFCLYIITFLLLHYLFFNLVLLSPKSRQMRCLSTVFLLKSEGSG